MPDDAVLEIYGRVKGLERAIAQVPTTSPIHSSTGKDISRCAQDLSSVSGKDYSYLAVEERYYVRNSQNFWFMPRQLANSKIFQLVNILESQYGCGERGIEAGIAYNFIQDVQLKSRCSDLLSHHKHFDRVINQATQVFEERIREISGLNNLVGETLVDNAIGGEPTKCIRFSDNPGEHRGYFNICKGIVGAFRNPTHHRIIDTITREDALKFCGFIDSMLGILNRCTQKQNDEDGDVCESSSE